MQAKDRKAMSTVIDQNLSIPASPMNAMAANDDHLPGSSRVRDTADSGWNAHDVWRRLIKEARDRRETKGQLPQ
jgi:hypothetical protein